MKKVYAVTAIWQNDNKEVTHVMLHDASVDGIPQSSGEWKTDLFIVDLIKSENKVFTAIWDYEAAKWLTGKEIERVNGIIRPYIRTKSDGLKRNNLENLPLMNPKPKGDPLFTFASSLLARVNKKI